MKILMRPRYAIFLVLFVLLIGYSLYQARALIMGPQIWILSPEDGEVLNSPAFSMEGQSRNIAWISLNGRQIFTDENGDWSEKLIVQKGLSIMTLEARDRFGREIKKSIRIILN